MTLGIRTTSADKRPTGLVTVTVRALCVGLLLLGGSFVKAPAAGASLQVGSFNVSTNYFWPGQANGRQMSAGQSVRWRGYVSPRLSTARVTIQYKVGSSWYNGAWVRPSSSGYFDVAQRFNSPGYKTVRLRVYSGTTSYNTWTGSPVNVTVYGWISLSALSSVSTTDPNGNDRYYFDEGTGRMGTTDYSTVFWQHYSSYYDGSAAAYDLRKKCTTFATTLGISSSTSNTSARSWFQVWGDSIQLLSRQSTFGTNQVLSINISSYLRLSLAMYDSVPYADSGIGNPRIRCSFSPS